MLRMEAIHEAFHQRQPGLCECRHNARGIGGIEAQRLFAQHRLAGGGAFDGPIAMHGIGQRNIDRIDAGIGKEVVIGDNLDAGLVTEPPPCLIRIAAGRGHQLAVPRFADAGHDGVARDPRSSTENSPSYRAAHWFSPRSTARVACCCRYPAGLKLDQFGASGKADTG